MKWEIDDSKQIHSQLVDEIIKRIINGVYITGEKIPSVRDLASEAKVNPNTMQKALIELEDRKIIITKRTIGKFVTEDKKLISSLGSEIANEIINNFISDMKNLGYESKDIIQKIKERI